jgi:hypothetical protein
MIFIIVPCSILLFVCLIRLKLVDKLEEKESFKTNYERYKYYSDVV